MKWQWKWQRRTTGGRQIVRRYLPRMASPGPKGRDVDFNRICGGPMAAAFPDHAALEEHSACRRRGRRKNKPSICRGVRPIEGSIARLGLEPRLSDPESLVLPLHHQAVVDHSPASPERSPGNAAPTGSTELKTDAGSPVYGLCRASPRQAASQKIASSPRSTGNKPRQSGNSIRTSSSRTYPSGRRLRQTG